MKRDIHYSGCIGGTLTVTNIGEPLPAGDSSQLSSGRALGLLSMVRAEPTKFQYQPLHCDPLCFSGLFIRDDIPSAGISALAFFGEYGDSLVTAHGG